MENLGIDLKLIIAQLINFGILFYVFQRFIAKPFLKYIQDERKKEEEKNTLLAQLNEQNQSLEEQRKELRQEQKKEMEKTMTEIKTEAEQLKTDLIKKAHKEADEIVAKAKIQLADEREAINKELKQKIATVSTLLVEKGLRNYLNEEEQKQVTKHIINSLPNEV